MEKKFKADNGAGNIFWGMAAVMLLALFIYRFTQGEEIWSSLIYFSFTLVFMLSTTIREYAVTELNFLEIRMVLKLFSKNRRIAIGDMVALKKVKKNQLRIDKVRGFEVLRVRERDIDALIAELKERNPRIIVAGENDDH
jgi:hypothetical protein